jgi:hypothetical protein
VVINILVHVFILWYYDYTKVGDIMSKTSAAVKNRYAVKTYDRIILQVKKGRKAEIQAAAVEQGKSVNKFIIKAIDEYLDDLYCQNLLNGYLTSDDKGDFVQIEEVARHYGISLS